MVIATDSMADYPTLPFVAAEDETIVLHLAAQVDSLISFLPFPFPLYDSTIKKEFITTLQTLRQRLEQAFDATVTIRLFKMKILPPGRIDDLFKSVQRTPVIANYDVVIMFTCQNQAVADAVQAHADYKAIYAQFQGCANHHIVAAKNIRKAGETHVHDHSKEGVYLFNYFYVEDRDFDFLPVWNDTSRWFVKNTQLNNSYLLKPISGDRHFQYINHCVWPGLLTFIPPMVFDKSLKNKVLDKFTANKAIAFPIIYQSI